MPSQRRWRQGQPISVEEHSGLNEGANFTAAFLTTRMNVPHDDLAAQKQARWEFRNTGLAAPYWQ